MRYTHTEKPNIALRLAALLLCLTLFSLYLLSGLYARYTVTGTAADSARVAAFQPTATITPATETIKYDYTKTTQNPPYYYSVSYTIKVTNPSEVAVNCELVIVLDERLASFLPNASFSIKVGEGAEQYLYMDIIRDPTEKTTDTVLLGTLDAHDTSGITCVLTYHFLQSQFDELIADQSWEGDLDLTQYFTASVTFTQVD